MLSWSLDRGLISTNPCERGGRLYRSGARVEKIWTATHESAFFDKAPAHLHLPLLLALWTGQRHGDLLRLPWSAYNSGVTVISRLDRAFDATAEEIVLSAGAVFARPFDIVGMAARARDTCEITIS